MNSQTVTNILTIVILIGGAFIAIAWFFTNPKSIYRRIRERYQRVDSKSSPVLLAKLLDSGELVNLMNGFTPKGNQYSYLIGSDFQAYGVYSVELPFISAAHVLGIAKNVRGSFTIDPFNSALEPMTLEGDYNRTFSVFVEHLEQDDGRYVIDPAAMCFTEQFCANYHWEILNDTLYFMNRGSLPSFEIIDKFIEEIQPALDSRKPVEHNAAKRPYGAQLKKALNCPICASTLLPTDGYLSCPNKHGLLLSSKEFIHLRDTKKLKVLPDGTKIETDRHLSCPNCDSSMKQMPYQQLPLAIDTCTSCSFRWIDSIESLSLVGVTV